MSQRKGRGAQHSCGTEKPATSKACLATALAQISNLVEAKALMTEALSYLARSEALSSNDIAVVSVLERSSDRENSAKKGRTR